MANKFLLADQFAYSSDSLPRGLQGKGIALDKSTNVYILHTEDADGPGTEFSPVHRLLQFSTSGSLLTETSTTALSKLNSPTGITVLPNGNLLVASAGTGRLNEFRPDGVAVTGADSHNFRLPTEFSQSDQRGLLSDLAYSPAYDLNNRFVAKAASVMVVTSNGQELVEFDMAGKILSSLDLAKFGIQSPQGVAINPANGNIFVADASEQGGGTNKIYEFTPIRNELFHDSRDTTDGILRNTQLPRFGSLVSVVDTKVLGFTDPSGLAFSPDGRSLHVVFGGDDPGPVARMSSDDSFTFDFVDGEGLTFRTADDTLFVLQASTSDPKQRFTIFPYDSNGIASGAGFTVDLGAFTPQDISVRNDNGNLILSGLDLGSFQQRFIEIDPVNRVKAPDGIDFGFPFGFTSGVFSGIYYNNDTGTIFGTDYLSKEVVEFDPEAGQVKTTNGIAHRWNVGSLLISSGFSPQAITYDTDSGHYFIAGDVDSANLIYEVGLEVDGENSPAVTLYGMHDTVSVFGIQDAEGLAIDTDTRTLYASFDNDRFDVKTFGSVTVPGIGAKVARATLSDSTVNEVATFTLATPVDLPTLRTIDKFGRADQAITLTMEDFTSLPSRDFAPDVPAFSEAVLTGITIVSLPAEGILTLEDARISLGELITVDQIPLLTYKANAGFSGVDTFQITASGGADHSAPAHIDLFVSSPDAQRLVATRAFKIAGEGIGGENDDRFNNSADGIVFNPVNGKIYTSSSFRINPTDPNTIGWRLIESDTDGSNSKVILQSEAGPLAVSNQTSYSPLPGVPILDLIPGDVTDGVQDVAVVQGTGTARDGNLLLLSTRGASLYEITPSGKTFNGGIHFVAHNIFESGAAFDRSAVGVFHHVEDGKEYVYVTDFGERLIRKVPALQGTASDPAILSADQVTANIELQTALPEARLQALLIDPVTGNYFVADDASGNAAIYEITPDGKILGSTDMIALGYQLGIRQGLDGIELDSFAHKFGDIEGLTLDTATRTLYAAIDDDGVGTFGLANIGRQVVAIALRDNARTLTGEADNDKLTGGDGADLLTGMDGNDLLLGKAHNDTLYGGNGHDVLYGNAGWDRLYGEAGDDSILGGNGRDRLWGGEGNDSLAGGLGRDTYLYGATTLGTGDLTAGTHDVIREVSPWNLLRFSPALMKVLTLDGQRLNGITSEVKLPDQLSVDDQIAYSAKLSSLLLDVNGDGEFAAVEDVQIELSGVSSISYMPSLDALLMQ